MQANDDASDNSLAPTEKIEQLTDRDVRALTEVMSVLSDTGKANGADDCYLVVTESGSSYFVDTRTEACECPDARHRDIVCKHLRRVGYATGERPIPAYVNREAIDDGLSEHVDGCPTICVGHNSIATDGGLAAEEGARGDECEDCVGEYP
jgi:hypothetical protein